MQDTFLHLRQLTTRAFKAYLAVLFLRIYINERLSITIKSEKQRVIISIHSSKIKIFLDDLLASFHKDLANKSAVVIQILNFSLNKEVR